MFESKPSLLHCHPPSLPSKSRRFAVVAMALATVCLASWSVTAPAQEAASPTITHIEEDWKIEIATPDPDNEAPQIIVVCSPTGSLNDHHIV